MLARGKKCGTICQNCKEMAVKGWSKETRNPASLGLLGLPDAG